MPNWCENEVMITGDKELLDFIQLNSRYSDNEFSMERFRPTPPQVLENKSGISEDKEAIAQAVLGNTNYEYDNWYEWRIANWGTKWDLADLNVDRSERTIFLNYNTAWAPNIPFWTYFSNVYPSLKITHNYLEEGMCFIGEAEYQDGQVSDYCIDINDDLWKLAGATFDEDGYVNNYDDASLWKLFPLSTMKERELS
jgi:hypothetical protein